MFIIAIICYDKIPLLDFFLLEPQILLQFNLLIEVLLLQLLHRLLILNIVVLGVQPMLRPQLNGIGPQLRSLGAKILNICPLLIYWDAWQLQALSAIIIVD
jgi:hypothetical protein